MLKGAVAGEDAVDSAEISRKVGCSTLEGNTMVLHQKTSSELWEEVKSRAQENGITSYEEFEDLVEEVMAENADFSPFGEGYDDEARIKSELLARWNELESLLQQRK